MIGINYTGSDAALNGCINDVNNMYDMLTQNCGYEQNNVILLTDYTPNQPTKANIETYIKWLVTGAKSGDNLFFHYSGHGSYVRDGNGDEADGRDEVLVPIDYTTAACISDDWLYDNLASKVPFGCTLYALTDCCHSGTMLDIRYGYQSLCTLKNGVLVNDMPYVATNWTDRFSMSVNKKNEVRGRVILLSGCLDPQTSADAFIRGQGQGALRHPQLSAPGYVPRAVPPAWRCVSLDEGLQAPGSPEQALPHDLPRRQARAPRVDRGEA